jgi:hypothetical protein
MAPTRGAAAVPALLRRGGRAHLLSCSSLFGSFDPPRGGHDRPGAGGPAALYLAARSALRARGAARRIRRAAADRSRQRRERDLPARRGLGHRPHPSRPRSARRHGRRRVRRHRPLRSDHPRRERPARGRRGPSLDSGHLPGRGRRRGLGDGAGLPGRVRCAGPQAPGRAAHPVRPGDRLAFPLPGPRRSGWLSLRLDRAAGTRGDGPFPDAAPGSEGRPALGSPERHFRGPLFGRHDGEPHRRRRGRRLRDLVRGPSRQRAGRRLSSAHRARRAGRRGDMDGARSASPAGRLRRPRRPPRPRRRRWSHCLVQRRGRAGPEVLALGRSSLGRPGDPALGSRIGRFRLPTGAGRGHRWQPLRDLGRALQLGARADPRPASREKRCAPLAPAGCRPVAPHGRREAIAGCPGRWNADGGLGGSPRGGRARPG